MIILTIIFFMIDLLSKLIICNVLNVYESIPVINNFFNITYVNNTGVAWSMFAGNRILLSIISLFIIICIIMYIRKKGLNMIERISYSMILGGAIGNLVDRIFLGYVIDFLDFNIFGYDYPIFNLADTFIVVGVILLLIGTWRK